MVEVTHKRTTEEGPEVKEEGRTTWDEESELKSKVK